MGWKFEMGCMEESMVWCKMHWTAKSYDLLRDPPTPALEPLISMTQKNNR